MKIALTIALAFSASTAVAAGQGSPGLHFLESWDINSDGAVTLEEAIERRSDVFTSFDYDDDGVLNSEEYDLFDEARANDMKENGIGNSGRKSKSSPATGMSREFTDTNGDGEVTRAEFMASVPPWFAKIDRNGDGTVTAGDFGRN